MRRAWTLLCFLWAVGAQAQFAWWNDLHGWDGTTPWTQYMKYAHAYLGPNALPLPSFVEGESSYFRTSSQLSLRADDRFVTNHNELFWKRGHTQFQIIHQSIEAYQTSEAVRNHRVARGESGRGVMAGDVLVNVSTSLHQGPNHQTYFSAHLKTAAGPLADARWTDAPGYAFFFSHVRRWEDQVRPRSQYLLVDAGFQVYQTFWTAYPQNDGFLGNVRYGFTRGPWRGEAGMRTFTGYFLDGDWPRILDVGGYATFGQTEVGLQWTRGLQDYPFSFLTLSCQWTYGE